MKINVHVSRQSDIDVMLEPAAYKSHSPGDDAMVTAFRGARGQLRGGQLRPGAIPVYTSVEVLGLFSQYAAVGLLYGVLPNLWYPVFTTYCNLSGAQVNSARTLISMGWYFKVFVGLFTDCVPIMGYRRKSWMMIGWFLCAVCMLVLAVRDYGAPYYDQLTTRPSEASIHELNTTHHNTDAIAHGAFIAITCGIASMCYIISDVAADALMVEMAQREEEASRGRLQSLAYTSRTMASVVAQVLLGVGLNSRHFNGDFSWDIGLNGLFYTMAVPCLAMVPVSLVFIRETGRDSVNMHEYFGLCWAFLQNRAVLQVMTFLFLFQFFTTFTTTAAPSVQHLWVNADNINSQFSSIVSNLVFAGGLALAGTYGTAWNWRVATISSVVAWNAIDAIVQFVTIFNGVRSAWFYLYTPLLEQLPLAIQFMVGLFVNIELADAGNEGISYALLTTVSNLPPAFSSVVSNIVCSYFDVEAAFVVQDTPAVRWQVSYTYFIQYGTSVIACVVALYLMPTQKAHVRHLKESPDRHPYWAIGISVAALGSLVFAIAASILSMYDSTSCLVIAGGQGCDASP